MGWNRFKSVTLCQLYAYNIVTCQNSEKLHIFWEGEKEGAKKYFHGDSIQFGACNLMAGISFVIFGKLSYLVKWRGDEIKHDDYSMRANEMEFPVTTTITQLIAPNRTHNPSVSPTSVYLSSSTTHFRPSLSPYLLPRFPRKNVSYTFDDLI